ncbi:hypothetical protein AAE478_007337 [Parahypoxylon ruwenzoriense]
MGWETPLEDKVKKCLESRNGKVECLLERNWYLSTFGGKFAPVEVLREARIKKYGHE